MLPNGTHTVTITRTGTSGGGGTSIGLDAFEVIGTPVQATPVPTAARYQDTDSRIIWTGLWDNAATASASGGCLRRIDKAGSASVTFDGTSLSWLATKDPSYGIARVKVDGADAGTVDLYSSAASYLQTVWSTTTLEPGPHTVTIEWTGDKNTAATGTTISLDAFDIMGTAVRPDGLDRYEQTDTNLVWAGTWATFTTSGPSGGSYTRASTNGASVTVNFTGTYLSWVAVAGTTLSKAYVSLDGGAEQSIDLARSAVAYQQSVWATGSLDLGPHTVKIRWDPGNATGKYISVDAFDVREPLSLRLPPSPAMTRPTQHREDRRLDQLHTHRQLPRQLRPVEHRRSHGHHLLHRHQDRLGRYEGHHHRQGRRLPRQHDHKADHDRPHRHRGELPGDPVDQPYSGGRVHYLRLVRSSSSGTGKFMTLDAVDIWGTIKAGP